MISGRRLLLLALTATLGAVVVAFSLLAFDSFDDDGDATASAVTPSSTTTIDDEGTPTPEPTPDHAQEFVAAFSPLGCELAEFSQKLNEWTAGAQARAERIEILGGIGFWREILSGIPPLVERLPSRERQLKTAANDYVGALDAYLAKLGEYWFTADSSLSEQAAIQLLFAEQQRQILQTAAEESAGGPLTLDCSL